MPGGVDWIAVDWGTSNLRAWGIGADGAIIWSRDSAEGMGRLSPDQYLDVLDRLVPEDLAPRTPVLVCGMAGARQGWKEAPYLDAPTPLANLTASTVSPDVSHDRFAIRILPGVCQRLAGAEDVMRGEETQLLGLLALQPDHDGLVVMPGTHSKWAWLVGGELTRFVSAMTGEVFEVLSRHSVLRHSLAGELDAPERQDGFDAGADTGLEHPEALLGMLFKTRAAALLSDRGPAWCAGYLSGLLIGSEIGANRHHLGAGTVPLIGGNRLCQLYARVLSRIDVATLTIDATKATLAGLKAAREQVS